MDSSKVLQIVIGHSDDPLTLYVHPAVLLRNMSCDESPLHNLAQALADHQEHRTAVFKCEDGDRTAWQFLIDHLYVDDDSSKKAIGDKLIESDYRVLILQIYHLADLHDIHTIKSRVFEYLADFLRNNSIWPDPKEIIATSSPLSSKSATIAVSGLGPGRKNRRKCDSCGRSHPGVCDPAIVAKIAARNAAGGLPVHKITVCKGNAKLALGSCGRFHDGLCDPERRAKADKRAIESDNGVEGSSESDNGSNTLTNLRSLYVQHLARCILTHKCNTPMPRALGTYLSEHGNLCYEVLMAIKDVDQKSKTVSTEADLEQNCQVLGAEQSKRSGMLRLAVPSLSNKDSSKTRLFTSHSDGPSLWTPTENELSMHTTSKTDWPNHLAPVEASTSLKTYHGSHASPSRSATPIIQPAPNFSLANLFPTRAPTPSQQVNSPHTAPSFSSLHFSQPQSSLNATAKPFPAPKNAPWSPSDLGRFCPPPVPWGPAVTFAKPSQRYKTPTFRPLTNSMFAETQQDGHDGLYGDVAVARERYGTAPTRKKTRAGGYKSPIVESLDEDD